MLLLKRKHSAMQGDGAWRVGMLFMNQFMHVLWRVASYSARVALRIFSLLRITCDSTVTDQNLGTAGTPQVSLTVSHTAVSGRKFVSQKVASCVSTVPTPPLKFFPATSVVVVGNDIVRGHVAVELCVRGWCVSGSF